MDRVTNCMRSHREAWCVLVRNGNYSTFNGRRFTPSAYSLIRCDTCGRCWRTKATYVKTLPDRKD